ncbi:hypothetical protein Tco_1478171, partial [Tanacetum coccineum]
MLEEYNHYITFRADPLPITKIGYKVDSSKQASIRITRGNNPLNLTLSTFDLPAPEKKIKRAFEILKEVFVKEDIRIFFYNGIFDLVFRREEEFHLATTAQLIRLQNAIQRGFPEAEEMFAKLELTIEARSDVTKARKIVEDNLAMLSDLRRIQVEDIVKEVEDYLKTYSSVGMDIK